MLWEWWARLRLAVSGPLARSLSLRLALTIASALVALLLAVGLLAATALRSELFNGRKDVVLADASLRYTQAQNWLNQSTASTRDQVQALASQVVVSARDSAAGAGGTAVLLQPGSDANSPFVINSMGNPELMGIVTPELAEMVDDGQSVWQSVAVPSGRGESPGILVGSLVELPQAGAYQMFIVYSLQSEQDTVELVMRVLLIALVPMVVVLAVGVFFLTFQQLRPVRLTAKAAARLAAGDLESRVEVSGADEMSRLGGSFNEMADSLQRQITEYDNLSRFQQRFVSDVSHELRTPLTTISMAEDMIHAVRSSLPPAAARSAELLHSEVARMEELLEELLEISRYDANQAVLDLEETDVYALTRRTVGSVSELAGRLGVEVQLSPRPDRATAEIDPKRVERVIRNLLLNAYEHAEGEPVEVDVAADAGAVAVRVRDHGVGMTAETAQRVFDRFFRANPSRVRTTGGTGLGLAIVKEDVTAHGGVVTAHGTLGEGSEFTVTLPKHYGESVVDFPLGGGW